MWIKFNKMHGLGNDFMVVDLVTQHAYLTPMQIRHLADRNFGVGFDQLLLVEVPTQPDVDFKYRIFNSDGSEVENCGNGARCFARFVYEQKLIGRRNIRVETASGNMTLSLIWGHLFLSLTKYLLYQKRLKKYERPATELMLKIMAVLN